MPDILRIIEHSTLKIVGNKNYREINKKIKEFWENENIQRVRQMVGGNIIAFINKFNEWNGQNSAIQNSNSQTNSTPNSASQTPNQQIPQIIPPIQNSTQTPETEEIPIFNQEDFQKEKKLNLKGIPDDKFTGEPKKWQIPIDSELKNGAQIKLCSNRKFENGKPVFGESVEYIIEYKETDKEKKTGEWKIIEPKKCCDDYSDKYNGTFLGIGGAVKLENGNLTLRTFENNHLKNPQLNLSIQYIKPELTTEEIAKVENKKQEEKYEQHSKTFQDLTKGIDYSEGNRLIPHKDALWNATITPCAAAYFDAQDFSDRKEERPKIQGKRAEDFESFNVLLTLGNHKISCLKSETTENDLLSPQPNQPNQINSPAIYQQYLIANSIGKQSEFVSRLAEKMTKEVFPVNRFSNEIINQNPILPDLNDIFGNGLMSVIPQIAVHLSKITLNPKPFDFDKINFAAGRLITDKNNDNPDTRGVLMTVEQILAVATYQFFRFKIEAQMNKITQDEITNKESLKNQNKTDFLNKIRTINEKIMEHKTQNDLTEEQIPELKLKMKNRYTEKNNETSIIVTLGNLHSLLNLGSLATITDQDAANLGLNFENSNQINFQNEMLMNLENACDYVISLENTTKTLQKLTQKFTEIQTKIQEKNPAFDIIEEIISKFTEKTQNTVRNLLKNITTDGKIDDNKVQNVLKKLEKLNIIDLTTRKNNMVKVLTVIDTINEEFDAKIKKESEELKEKTAKLTLYKDILKVLKDRTSSNFEKYKLVCNLDDEIKEKIWQGIKNKIEITSKNLTKENVFDTKNTDKTYAIGLYSEVQKEMEKVLQNEVADLEKSNK